MAAGNEISRKIEESFIEILKTTEFNKCKVTEIIKLSGISHQSFYRHYVDKYDLAYQLVLEKLSAFKLIYGDNATWKDIVLSDLYSIQNNPVLFKRLLESIEGSDIILKCFVSQSVGGKVSIPGIAGWVQIFKEWSRHNFAAPVSEIYIQVRNNISIRDILPPEEVDKRMSQYEKNSLDYYRKKTAK